jgi:hypothetical protein
MNCNISLKRETRHLICTIVACCLIAASSSDAKVRRVVVKPRDAGETITIMIGGKARAYYPLSSRGSTVVSVKGPGELRVLTRVRFAPGAPGELSYQIRYRVDGAGQQLFDVDAATPSTSVRYKDVVLGVPGDVEDLIVRVGRGYHSIELLLGDSLPQVSARYLLTPRKEKKTRWIALAPLKPAEPVNLLAGEDMVHYYRFSREKPLRVEIIGPTELRLMTRVENTFNMKGRARYRLQVKQDGSVIQTYQLSSIRSETTTYENNKKLIPGKAREIVFKVPKGLQRYEVIPLDGKSLLGQIMFPRKDVKLGL